MNLWEILALVSILGAGAVVVWGNGWRLRQTLRRMDAMLERAIRGDFTEDTFDETLLSSVGPNWLTTSLPRRYPPGICRRKRTPSTP